MVAVYFITGYTLSLVCNCEHFKINKKIYLTVNENTIFNHLPLLSGYWEEWTAYKSKWTIA